MGTDLYAKIEPIERPRPPPQFQGPATTQQTRRSSAADRVCLSPFAYIELIPEHAAPYEEKI
ncbi:UNVERIFIED_CONTAM: hypothetical protein RMT77_012951 [Armadillidium vulgare]